MMRVVGGVIYTGGDDLMMLCSGAGGGDVMSNGE